MKRLLAVMASVTLAGCFSVPSGPLVPDPDPVRDLAGFIRMGNLSAVLEGVSDTTALLKQYRIPMADGVRLDAWVVRPDVEEKVPILLEVTPYQFGGDPQKSEVYMERWLPRSAHKLVPRGYAFGMVSVRGTGNSEGCFTQGGPQEAKDTAAVIEALAKEPWSNGKVGLIGVSYPGTTPQDVWVEAPPSLKTIVPISGISDMYKYNFVNGVPINVQGFGFNTYYWYSVGLGGSLGGTPWAIGHVRDPVHAPGAIAGEACDDQVEVQEGGVSSTLDGNKDSYWQVRDFLAEYRAAPDKARASVFYVHGLQDWNVKPHMMEDWLPALQAAGVPYKILLGQWGHAWPDRHDWWDTVLLAWFDEFLKDRRTGILDAPAVQVRADNGRWRHEAMWPPVHVENLTLFPSAGRLEASPGTGSASYRDAAALPADVPDDSVVWESAPFAEEAYLSGQPFFEANVTASGQRASLLLTLAVRNATGTRSINYAAQSLNHVKSLAQGDPDVAGERQHVHVRFFPQDDVVGKGERLLLIASGTLVQSWNGRSQAGPSLQPIATGSTITIDLAGAWLVLPIDRTVELEDPQPGVCKRQFSAMDDCTEPKRIER